MIGTAVPAYQPPKKKETVMVEAVMQQIDPVAFAEGKARLKIGDMSPQARVEIIKRALTLLIKEIPDNYDPSDSTVEFQTLSKSLERDWHYRHRDNVARNIQPHQIPLDSIGHVPGDRFWTLEQTGHFYETCVPGGNPISKEVVEHRVLLSRRSLMLYVVRIAWSPWLDGDNRYHYEATEVILENDNALEKLFGDHPHAVQQVLITFCNLANGLVEKAAETARRRSELKAEMQKRSSAFYI
jgi:hypothetical protein